MKKCEECNNLYTCKMIQGRFNVKLCSKNYKDKIEKKHNKELKKRKKVNINWDYKSSIDKGIKHE